MLTRTEMCLERMEEKALKRMLSAQQSGCGGAP